jgi:DNA-binding NtrC family response regulator
MDDVRLNVLVVDDEPALREVLSLRIADWGHDVRAVEDVAAAEREIDRSRPDIVLCDLVLPGGSGMELLKRIKRHDEKLPVVMMTAHGNIDGAVEAMKAGAADFLTKPLDHNALFALLTVLAEEHRASRVRRTLNERLDGQRSGGLVGQSRVMRAFSRTIESLAQSDASAILTGESGTGKEVAARTIHALSARADKQFVAAARCSSTRSPRCRSRSNPSSSACSRTDRPGASAAAATPSSTFACSRPRTARRRRRSAKAACAKTCTTA